MPIGNIIKNLFTGGASQIVDSVTNVISEFHLSPEDKLKAEQAILEATNKHIEAMEVEVSKQIEQQVKEMDSARQRELQIAISDKAPLISKIITPVLALAVITLTFIMFYMVMFKPMGAEKDVVVYVLGVLSAIDTQIVSYYYGSSIGSHQKQERLDKLIK